MIKEKISILMTVFNAEEYLSYSIKSILKQTYKNWELLIIDDCSTDNSLRVIKNFRDKRIKIFKLKKHLGRTKSLNFGLKKIRNKYIAILDADDFSFKNRLYDQINFFKKNKDIDLIGTWYELINNQGKIIRKQKMTTNINIIKKSMFYKNIFCHSSVMFRKKILKKVKNYPSKFIYMQDYAFILKAIKYYKVSILPNFLVKSRLTKSSMTFTVPSKQILKERIDLLNFTYRNFKQDILTIILWLFEYFKARLKLIFVDIFGRVVQW